MDTQLVQNFSLIEEIKMEAIESNIYEAFLESAPQVLFQLLALLNFQSQGKQKVALCLVNYFSRTITNGLYLP
jgi:hypothetical protein